MRRQGVFALSVMVVTIGLLCACAASSVKVDSKLDGKEETIQLSFESGALSGEMLICSSPELRAYLDFLRNKTDFTEYHYIDPSCHSIIKGDTKNFADYMDLGDGYCWEVTEYTVVDMNDDGIKELLLSMKHPLSASIAYRVLVLTFENDALYGISLTNHSFSSLKKDGTYISSWVSSGHWGIMRLFFSSGDFSFEETRSPNYYEQHLEFCDFVDIQNQKEDVEWFAFTSEFAIKLGLLNCAALQ